MKDASDFQKEADPTFEDEIRRNPYSIRVWTTYASSRKGASIEFQYSIYTRALEALPRCYKLWSRFLKLSVDNVSYVNSSEREAFLSTVLERFRQALIHVSKMPRIWIFYIEFLISQGNVTSTREVISQALRALPVTQHYRIWDLAMRFIKDLNVPLTTAKTLFKRYLMLEPDHIETYIAYLISKDDYDEATFQLAQICNKDDFQSIENKTSHDLWLDLCELLTTHPKKIKRLSIETVLRSGLSRFSDDVARLWNWLAEHHVRLGKFAKARDVYEEALSRVATAADFSIIFEAYQKFLESLVTVYMRRGDDESAELSIAVLEDLLDRRGDLLSSVSLRSNPHNVTEWLRRAKLFANDPVKLAKIYAEAVKAVDPQQAVGPLGKLWSDFGRMYGNFCDIENMREVFERGVNCNFRHVDDLATVWIDWIAAEPDRGLEISRRAVSVYKTAPNGSVQSQLKNSVRLWHVACDQEEALGTPDSLRAVFDAMIRLKVATPATVLNFAAWEEDNGDFDNACKCYESGVALFPWPHCRDIWLIYLSKISEKFIKKQFCPIDTIRELFERCLASNPPGNLSRHFFQLYATFEEERGLWSNSLKILKNGIPRVDEKLEFARYLFAKNRKFFGLAASRDSLQWAVEYFGEISRSDMIQVCVDFAEVEIQLGEPARARALFTHAAQVADPKKEENSRFWSEWQAFEVKNGNEESFKDMRRIKRAIEVKFSGVVPGAKFLVEDAPTSAPEILNDQVREMVAEAAAEQAERLLRFEPSVEYKGSRKGFVFKRGVQGVGYYEDASSHAAAAKLSAVGRDALIEMD